MSIRSRKSADEEFDFLTELFQENPNMSVDQACKACDKYRFPVHKSLITGIRRRVREQMQLDQSKLRLVPLPKEEEELEVEVEETQLQEPESLVEIGQHVPEPVAEETKDQRRARKRSMVDDLVLANPAITTTEITKEIQKNFNGEGVEIRYLLDSLAIAREYAGLPIHSKPKRRSVPTTTKEPEMAFSNQPRVVLQQQPAPKPPQQQVQMAAPPAPAPVKAPEPKPIVSNDHPMRIISWHNSRGDVEREEVRVEDVKDKVMMLLGRGIKDTAIEMWKRVPLRIAVAIDMDEDKD